MKKTKLWAPKYFFRALFIALCVVVFVALIRLGRTYDLTKSDWSGWVQAVGSIGAILAGFIVVDQQIKSAARLARRERREADDDRVVAALCTALFAQDLIQDTLENMKYPTRLQGYLLLADEYYDLDGAARVLADIPLHALRSSSMIDGVLSLQRCIARIKALTSTVRGLDTFEEFDGDEWASLLAFVQHEKDAAISLITEVASRSRLALDASQ